MSQSTSIALNKAQNSPDFKLDSLKDQPSIFKRNLVSKTLDPPKENPEILENYRTITVTCLIKGYT